jgi:hypothetical protein
MITLRVHVLNFSSDYFIENNLPFIDILFKVRGSGIHCYIIDDVISFKFVESLKAALYNLGAKGEANHRNSLGAKGVAEGKRDPNQLSCKFSFLDCIFKVIIVAVSR